MCSRECLLNIIGLFSSFSSSVNDNVIKLVKVNNHAFIMFTMNSCIRTISLSYPFPEILHGTKDSQHRDSHSATNLEIWYALLVYNERNVKNNFDNILQNNNDKFLTSLILPWTACNSRFPNVISSKTLTSPTSDIRFTK